MSETTNYKLYVNDDATEKFLSWRTQMNAAANSNMTKIDDALKTIADAAAEAQGSADAAQVSANKAANDAALAQASADDAMAAAKAAQNSADTAQTSADNAQNSANDAQSAAEAAQETANNAVDIGNAAQLTADQAVQAANDAQEAADKGVSDAAKAQTAADAAQETANAAINDAGGKQDQHSTIILTLAVDSWVDNTTTTAATGVTETNTVFVCPVPDYMQAYISAGVVCITQATDSLTFSCETVPEEDLNVSVVIFN